MKLIYSAGGHAREFRRLVKLAYPGETVQMVDDAPAGEVIDYQAARGMVGEFVIGFANAALRREKTALVTGDGFELFSVTAPTAIVGENVEIGPGFVLSDFSMLTTDLRVGQGFHANMYAYVAHDCVVGDFVTLAPRASVNGRVVIEDDVYIGAGATILQGKPGKPITIGRGAVVGAHALVTRDVAPGTTVVGVPAKPLERGA